MPTPNGVNYLLQFLQYFQFGELERTRIQKWMFILYVLYVSSQPIGIKVLVNIICYYFIVSQSDYAAVPISHKYSGAKSAPFSHSIVLNLMVKFLK